MMPSAIAVPTSAQPATDINDEPESSVENEREDPQEKITDPFDPEQIKIRTVNIVVGQLVSRIGYEEIDLAPDFQRLRGIWNTERKSRLIESLLLRFPSRSSTSPRTSLKPGPSLTVSSGCPPSMTM